MRRIRSTGTRETGGRGTPRDPVLHIDALAARVGHQPKQRCAVRARSGFSGSRDAARYLALFRSAWRHPGQRDCQSAVLTLLEAAVLEVLSDVQPLPDEVFFG